MANSLEQTGYTPQDDYSTALQRTESELALRAGNFGQRAAEDESNSENNAELQGLYRAAALQVLAAREFYKNHESFLAKVSATATASPLELFALIPYGLQDREQVFSNETQDILLLNSWDPMLERKKTKHTSDANEVSLHHYQRFAAEFYQIDRDFRTLARKLSEKQFNQEASDLGEKILETHALLRKLYEQLQEIREKALTALAEKLAENLISTRKDELLTVVLSSGSGFSVSQQTTNLEAFLHHAFNSELSGIYTANPQEDENIWQQFVVRDENLTHDRRQAIIQLVCTAAATKILDGLQSELRVLVEEKNQGQAFSEPCFTEFANPLDTLQESVAFFEGLSGNEEYFSDLLRLFKYRSLLYLTDELLAHLPTSAQETIREARSILRTAVQPEHRLRMSDSTLRVVVEYGSSDIALSTGSSLDRHLLPKRVYPNKYTEVFAAKISAHN